MSPDPGEAQNDSPHRHVEPRWRNAQLAPSKRPTAACLGSAVVMVLLNRWLLHWWQPPLPVAYDASGASSYVRSGAFGWD